MSFDNSCQQEIEISRSFKIFYESYVRKPVKCKTLLTLLSIKLSSVILLRRNFPFLIEVKLR